MKNLEEKFEEFVSKKENQSEYYISTDGLVCCKGDVFIYDEDLVNGKLPFEFGKVDGDFICSGCYSLTSLEGSPQKVGGYFDCNNCRNLTSLVCCPKEVGGKFDCSCCTSLTTLEGCPEKVCGDFDCRYCKKLTSLDWAPDFIGGIIHVSEDMNLDVDVA